MKTFILTPFLVFLSTAFAHNDVQHDYVPETEIYETEYVPKDGYIESYGSDYAPVDNHGSDYVPVDKYGTDYTTPEIYAGFEEESGDIIISCECPIYEDDHDYIPSYVPTYNVPTESYEPIYEVPVEPTYGVPVEPCEDTYVTVEICEETYVPIESCDETYASVETCEETLIETCEDTIPETCEESTTETCDETISYDPTLDTIYEETTEDSCEEPIYVPPVVGSYVPKKDDYETHQKEEPHYESPKSWDEPKEEDGDFIFTGQYNGQTTQASSASRIAIPTMFLALIAVILI